MSLGRLGLSKGMITFLVPSDLINNEANISRQKGDIFIKITVAL
jgi:hypothetical protein